MATVLAIVLGVGFVAATLVFGATYQAGLGAEVAATNPTPSTMASTVAITRLG